MENCTYDDIARSYDAPHIGIPIYRGPGTSSYTRSMLKLVSVVIRVTDLPAQSEFWKAALDYVERDPADDDWIVLKPRDAEAPCIALDAHHSERVLPPRIHLDIYAEDQSAEVQRLRGLGAREVHWDGRPTDADYVIMEDPEGNRFCIVDRPDWSGWDDTRGE